MKDNTNEKVPLWEKYVLTREEAIEYFNIGEKKMRKLIQDHIDDNTFVISNGKKTLILRKKFEEFLDNTSSIQGLKAMVYHVMPWYNGINIAKHGILTHRKAFKNNDKNPVRLLGEHLPLAHGGVYF